MLVSTWIPKNTTAMMETWRWSSCCAKPGQARARERLVVTSPRTMVSVRRIRATIPLARVVYHR